VYEPGSVLAGKYRVEGVLGRGGMGVVVAAEHLELRVPVALKFLGERYASRSDVVERFLREARAAAQLRSEHACRVSDVARLETGVPYIVMERLVGRDLSRVLREDGPLEVAMLASYIVQACDAIGEAHAAGIIHRDLKPGNLFVTQRRDGSALIKVLDFGVAKLQSEQDHAITSNRAVIGSPNYMAPEQLRSARSADPRSDIWSLGVILHQLVSGRPPFEGETVADLAIKVATEPLPPLAGVPAEYAAIVARCLEKPPDRRFQSVAELAAALAPLAAAAPRFASQPVPTITADLTAPTETTLRGAASAMTVRAARPPRRPLVIVMAAAIVIGVGAGVMLSRGGGDDPPAAGVATQPIAPMTVIVPADAAAVTASPPDAPQLAAPAPPPPVKHVRPPAKHAPPPARPAAQDIGASRI